MQTSMRSHACSRRHVGMGVAHACAHGRSRAQMHTRACCPSPHHHGRHQAVHCRQRHAAAPAVCAGVACLVLAWRLKDLRYSGFVSRKRVRSRSVNFIHCRREKMLVVKTLRPLQQPRKATKEVLGLSWQCGSSTPVITSGKRSAGARCVSSDVPWRSLAKIDGRRCRQGGDVGLASREPRAVHREAGHTQPGVAAVRVVRSVEPASGQTCATSA